VDRGALWSAQTPQTFRRSALLEVLAQAEADGFRPTDDAALWERYVGPVAIVAGDATNLKITRARDLELLRALLSARGAAEDPR
jgi:2-C-methyl-D-erythritol 4-phosphate cytidylyltransferase